jgi:hypothetical protein
MDCHLTDPLAFASPELLAFWDRKTAEKLGCSACARACWPVTMLNTNNGRKQMDTDDVILEEMNADLVLEILDEHERVLFDDELEGI